MVIALTGSAGKTTTKDILAQVLARHGATVATPGSFNTEIGAAADRPARRRDHPLLVHR